MILLIAYPSLPVIVCHRQLSRVSKAFAVDRQISLVLIKPISEIKDHC